MPLSFEELADSGTSDIQEVLHKSERSRARVVALSALCLLCVGGWVYSSFFQEKLPDAAVILLSVDAEVPGVLPHELDGSTEFEDSFHYLKDGESGPEYRETNEAVLSRALVIVEAQEPVEAIDVARIKPVVVTMAPVPVVEVPEPLPAAELLPIKAVVDESVLMVESPSEIPMKIPVALVVPSDSEVQYERDWSGLVLVPNGAKLAKAYTSNVRLTRVEAHPIDGERLRVWARIQNLTDEDFSAEVGCEFRSSDYSLSGSARFEPALIPSGGVVDVYFESPRDRVESYTVMVKQGFAHSYLASR